MEPVENPQLIVNVQKNEGQKLSFRTNRNKPLHSVMKAFSDRVGDNYGSLLFLFSGRIIQENQTPNDVEMKDGDTISVIDDAEEIVKKLGKVAIFGVKKESSENNVTLMVQHQDKPDLYFEMNRDDPIRKLMISYCERMNLGDYRQSRFTLDGVRVRGDQTPNELKLVDDDILDVWSEQLGGYPSYFETQCI